MDARSSRWQRSPRAATQPRRVGTVFERCTVSASAIPWLSLPAVSSDGPGVFERVTFIQRVNTVGGTAPTTAGTSVGQIFNVPYTAEYYFYR